MQTVTIEITGNKGLKALHALEQKKIIRIVENEGFDSAALPGEALSLKAFKNWINRAEDTVTVNLKDAKEKWATQRKQLQQLTK